MNQPHGVRLSTVGRPRASPRPWARKLSERFTMRESWRQSQAFVRDQHARQAARHGPRTQSRRFARDIVHESVAVAGIVVKDRERADAGSIGDAHALLPGRMAPALVAIVFLVGV